ncbi:MAG: patatin-like phospholipase family protein [Nannocystaceae bacterium]
MSHAPNSRNRAKPGRPCLGLVLSGGGARGAYEIGVLRYVREKLKIDTHFDVITGTSVGAINGAYLAATCDRPRAQGRMLQRVWSELTIDKVYQFGWPQLRGLPRVLFGKNLAKVPHGSGVGGLVDSRHLERIVRTQIPWRSITENLHRGHLRAFACTATEVATGLTTTFVHTASRELPYWPSAPHETVVRTPITAAHALASAAIPVLFPAVQVGDQLFVDGSLRQNTPLRPALRLGAERLLVVGLRSPEPNALHHQQREHAQQSYPNAIFMLGKMLNALMLDKIEADLERIERTNRLLLAGTSAFGTEFGATLAAELGRPDPYRPVQTVLIRPSSDLGKMAWEEAQRTGLTQYNGLAARWIRRMIAAGDNQENDVASYVLFDSGYLRRAIDLGYQDAEAQRDDLLSLFDR